MKFDIKKKKINIFKIGNLYCFKQYFDDKEIFKELSEYYNEKKYRFECRNSNGRKKIMKLLRSQGFEPTTVEDFSDYQVKINKFKKYASILKNSIEHTELDKDRIFIMKDMFSVEQALNEGAERYTTEINIQ